MNAQQLQEWLLDSGISKELGVIARALVLSELENTENDEQVDSSVSAVDWQRLLLAGSILARSQRRHSVEAALRIATASVILQDAPTIKDGGALLFQQLSNYRSVDLANERGLIAAGLERRLGLSSRIETVARSLDDSVLIEHSGAWLRINQFQEEFWDKAKRNSWISASAPTASGKTYLVLQWLLDQVASASVHVVVYLAPTRALVSEIEGSISQMIATEKLDGIAVTSLPLTEMYTEARLGGDRAIFVLTQERLHLLANALKDDLIVDLVVADEAHKVGDRLRGVVLQDAFERVLRTNPTARFVFISPATQNPETLLEDAPATIGSSAAVDSDSPTVLQNVILATQRPLKTTRWGLKLRQAKGQEVDIGTLELSARPTTLKKKLALIAAAAGARGGTLVYTNGAKEAEDVAQLISQLVVPTEAESDSELLALADLAKRGVHEQYLLASVARRGVAFHYGNMPSLLREEVERLFRSGKLRFLVCTSTLVEGVNLSCRTIVVRGPRKGKTQPMEPHDFWNLAGRAGRWGNEFQGNIICVDPENSVAWPHGVPERMRYPIRRETDVVVSEPSSLISFIQTRWEIPADELSEHSQHEQVASYLLANFMRQGNLTSAALAKRHSPEIIQKLEAALEPVAARIRLPEEVVSRHSAVNAVGMQRLLQFFQSAGPEIERCLPAAPESDDAYKRMTTVMGLINEHLYPAFQPGTLVPLHALVVLEWLKGLSLSAIIRKRITYQQKHGRPVDISKLIRGTMEMVEQIARFRAPKYLAAYMDVMAFHLAAIGKSELLAANQLDVGVALEFGVSTKTLLSLLELGLSRMSAVAIAEKIIRDDLGRSEARQWIIDHDAELDSMEIPVIIVSEIRRKILVVG